MNINQRNY